MEAAGASKTSATSYQATPRAHKFSKKSLRHVKILGGGSVTQSKFHTEEQQVLGTTVPNVVAAESWCLLYMITLCNFVVPTFSAW